EALVSRKIDHDARIMRIVFHDQQNGIARMNFEPVVRDLLGRALGGGDLHSDRRSTEGGSGGRRAGGGRWAAVFQRQIKRKGAAHAGRTAQMDFAAEEVRQLAADRETEAGSAVLAAGACIGLLE